MPKSQWAAVLIALLVMAMGLVPMLAAIDVIPSPEASFHAPRWIVFLAGGLFFVVGLWLLLQPLAGPAVAKAFGAVVGIVTLLGLALLSNWIAFGPGTRDGCSGGISIPGVSIWTGAAEWECRAAFGYGAALLDAFMLKGLFAWAAKWWPASPPLRILEKGTDWIIMGILLPLLLLAVLLRGIPKAGASLARMVRSGSRDAPPDP